MVMSKNLSHGVSNQTSGSDTESDCMSSQMSASLNFNKFARLNILRRNSVNAHNLLLKRISTLPG